MKENDRCGWGKKNPKNLQGNRSFLSAAEESEKEMFFQSLDNWCRFLHSFSCSGFNELHEDTGRIEGCVVHGSNMRPVVVEPLYGEREGPGLQRPRPDKKLLT